VEERSWLNIRSMAPIRRFETFFPHGGDFGKIYSGDITKQILPKLK